MTPAELAFVKPVCQACLVWESGSGVIYKRLVSITTVIQAILETGWGKSSLCAYHNYGGVKHHLPQWPGVSMQTREVIQSQNEVIKDAFQTYPTLTDYIADHAEVLLRWACVRNSLNVGLTATFEALGPWNSDDLAAIREHNPDASDHSNYSTDPTYPQSLMTLAEEFGFLDLASIDRYAA